jgi:hypothetical protein
LNLRQQVLQQKQLQQVKKLWQHTKTYTETIYQ